LVTRGGYRDSGDDTAELRALEASSRIEQLEGTATQDFWAHPEFIEVAALRQRVNATRANAGARGTEYSSLLHTYERALEAALTRAHELEAAALNTFGELPAPPICHAHASTWLERLFDKSPPDDDLADLEVNFDKFLRRMDAAACRVTIGRGVYYARLEMRGVPVGFGVSWEQLRAEHSWQLSVPTRIGLRPFSVTCHYPLVGESTQWPLTDDGTTSTAQRDSADAVDGAECADTAEPRQQSIEFSSLLRVSGNSNSANLVLNSEVQSYLVELAKATTPKLLVSTGCATLSFAQQLNQDLLKYSLRVLMATHAAPATLDLLR
jgi:hypothetical protein